ncbi:hypothetical protein DHB64_16900 [Antarcticibacterium sp. W02-3]|nr:hypothetical protein [Antarcticibacterium sp. W02-3]
MGVNYIERIFIKFFLDPYKKILAQGYDVGESSMVVNLFDFKDFSGLRKLIVKFEMRGALRILGCLSETD